MAGVFTFLQRLKNSCLDAVSSRFAGWTKPLTSSLPLQTLADLSRSKSELIAENALLRQQLIILKRQVKRPACTKTDRVLLVFVARVVRTWKQALFIVQPDTLLRWHRELFRLYWKRKSKTHTHKPKIAAETIALIREMATNNRLWGAERIRGELLKLGIHVCKRTIQKYMRTVRTQQPKGQTWSTFLRNHAAHIWACNFLQVTDLFFRPLVAFFLIELQSRKADPCRSDTLSDRFLGGAYRCEKRPRMGKHRTISFEITIANLDPVSTGWRRPVASNCSKLPITLHEPMPSVNAS